MLGRIGIFAKQLRFCIIRPTGQWLSEVMRKTMVFYAELANTWEES